MAELDDLLAKIRQLEAENAALRTGQPVEAADGSAVAQGAGAKSVATGGVLIEGGVYLGDPTDDPVEAIRIYRRVLMQTTSSLPLLGVDETAADPTSGQKPIGLVNVYIDLDTTKFSTELPSDLEEMRDEGEVERSGESAQNSLEEINRSMRRGFPTPQEERTPLPALQAFALHRKCILLGDPGSGKSTFVNFLAHCLAAHPLEPQAGWLAHLPGLPAADQDTLPLMVVLRDFARSLPAALPDQAQPRHLWDFITRRLEDQNLGFTTKPILRALDQGGILVLLDGLDEIPSLDQRAFVRDAVRAFMGRYSANRYLITCRVLSYQPPEHKAQPDLRLPEIPDFTLAPFDEEKIDRFVNAWYDELARLGTVAGEDAPGLAARLREAVRRPDLWRMAPNPLLLTVMALVHTHKGHLPNARALLYEETVDFLLWRWEQKKQGGRQDAPYLRQMLHAAGRTDVDLKRALWELAYEAHTGAAAEDENTADIGELRLQKALAALNQGNLNWADEMIEVIKLRAGLLLERIPGTFTFPHRTFQEYLAGAHLASQTNFAVTAAQLAGQGALWTQVILLAAGKLVYLSGEMDKPLALVGELCPAAPPDTEDAWQKAWLAGEVLLEIGPARAQDSVLGRDLLVRVQLRLAALLAAGALTSQKRALAGNTLAALGDLRFDPDFHHLPAEPLHGFVEIPAGKFVMGSDKKHDSLARDNEMPQHEPELPSYWLARYPVTVAQYRAYVEATGRQPADGDSLRGFANHPVNWITWHEALAYCNWLDGILKAAAAHRAAVSPERERPFWAGLAEGKLRVTLPSEAEWEKAAHGGNEVPTSSPEAPRIYPWGEVFDRDKANTAENGLHTTSPVGCFPRGASLDKILDLSGNVWEWTRSHYQDYPYQPGDGRENLAAGNEILRVLRGGSFIYVEYSARCAARYRNNPHLRSDHLGFRVVVSPSS